MNCEDDPTAGVLPLTATEVIVGVEGALGVEVELPPHAHSTTAMRNALTVALIQ